jgi:hypothetical protein
MIERDFDLKSGKYPDVEDVIMRFPAWEVHHLGEVPEEYLFAEIVSKYLSLISEKCPGVYTKFNSAYELAEKLKSNGFMLDTLNISYVDKSDAESFRTLLLLILESKVSVGLQTVLDTTRARMEITENQLYQTKMELDSIHCLYNSLKESYEGLRKSSSLTLRDKLLAKVNKILSKMRIKQ